MKKNQLFLLVCLPLLMFLLAAWLLLFARLPSASVAARELQNSGHAVAFFVLGFFFILYLYKFVFRSSLIKSVFVAALILLLFSGATEFVQIFIERDASWSDLLNNALGIVCAALALTGFYTRRYIRWLCFFSVAIALLWNFRSPVYWYYAGLKRDAIFPVLGDFELAAAHRYFAGRYAAKYSIVESPADWKENATKVAKVIFPPQRAWPGLHLIEMPSDWSGYRTLRFEAFNPQASPLKIVVRVHDAHHNNEHGDRFNRTFKLAPGEQTIEVSVEDILNTRSGRVLDIKRIDGMMVYMFKPASIMTLYFDNFQLE